VLETLTPPTIAQALGTVLDELAYRIFTDIASVGSPIWRAVESYSEGLRTYRQTLGTERHRQAKLLRAEKLFIKARAEDNKFARCYYNLGIVYKDLKRYDSDRAAFELARERDPTLADAAYALAFDYFNRGNYRNALVYTERAINIRPRDPLAGDSRRFHSAARRAAAISSTVGSGSRSLKATKSPRRWHGGSCARLRYHRRCQLPARR
jgi:tetratricopeptide (TPR) repeat protein